MKTIKSIIRLRRDNSFNYAKIGNTFIPANGEVCLVDTPTKGLRTKTGDGVTVFANLKYDDERIYEEIENVIVKGFLKDDVFYSDVGYQNTLTGSGSKLYVNLLNNKIYSFDGTKYDALEAPVPTASAEVPGTMRLYNTTGQNTDGTMTQKAITDELNEKFEMSVDDDDELIIFKK